LNLSPTSIVVSWREQLCRVLKRFIASVYRVFVDFLGGGGLDKVRRIRHDGRAHISLED
jgi:hypothetical protein